MKAVFHSANTLKNKMFIILQLCFVFYILPVSAREANFSSTPLIDDVDDISRDAFLGYELFQNHNSVMFILDPETATIVYANNAAHSFYGYENMKGMKISELNILSEQEIKKDISSASKDRINTFHFKHKLKNGAIKDVEVNSYPIKIRGKNFFFSVIKDISETANQSRIRSNHIFLSIIRDITKKTEQERKQLLTIAFIAILLQALIISYLIKIRIENKKISMKQKTFNKILNILNHPFERNNAIESITNLIEQDYSFDSVAVRLKKGNDYNYYAFKGFSHDFIEQENSLFACKGVPDNCKNCLCGMVIHKIKKLPFFNENYSLVIGDLKKDLIKYEKDIPNYRRACLIKGYRSLALIPIVVADENIGLLQVNNRKPNKISKKDVEFLEKISKSIGIAIDRQNAEEALKKSKETAEKANKTKSEFLANMSHEIRTPMNAVLGLTQLLQLTDLNDRQNNYVNNIMVAGQSLLYLINDILDFSKIEAEKFELVKQPFFFEESLKALAVILCVNSRNKDVEVLFDIDPQIPLDLALIGDNQRLEQILINLSGNALKFTKKGHVIVGIKQISRDDDNITINFAVKDTGIGISQTNIKRIFEPFEQEDGSTSRLFGGTGLGLAISQKMVNLMGGEISVESELGKGSVFSFTIKFLTDKEAKSKDLPKLPEKLRILIVDENKDAGNCIKRTVGISNWNICCCQQLKEAEKLFKENTYDVIFVDKTNKAKKIRKITSQKRAKIILTSCHDIINYTDDKMFDEILPKPATSTMIFEAIINSFKRKIPQKKTSAKEQILKGVKILIAEDNEINLMVAKDFLEDYGATIITAKNGFEAVKKVSNKLDLVFMDIQMPELDGYAATLEIRKKPELKELPIIAMTANAMQSDKDKCLKVGMNGHIAKPLEINNLLKAISEWVNIEPVKITKEALKQDGWFSDIPIFENVNINTALEWTSYNKDKFITMIESFVEKYKNTNDKLSELLVNKDLDEIMNIAHSIKGITGILGATALSKKMELLEEAAREKQEENFESLFIDAQQELTKAVDSFKKINDILIGSDNDILLELDLETLKEKVKELEKLLKTNNLKSHKIFNEIKGDLQNKIKVDVKALEKNIRTMNFSDALKMVKAIEW